MALDSDDLEPRKPLVKPGAGDLSRLSVGELEARIADLEAEIARCRDAIAARLKTRDSAEAIFKR